MPADTYGKTKRRSAVTAPKSRSVEDLEAHAEKFWPARLAEREQSSSIVPRLIDTQEKFIGILYVADASPHAWKGVLEATTGMPANLFLKHLIVLSDVGGEKLQRFRSGIASFFPHGKINYAWNERQYTYAFKSLGLVKKWTNPKLAVDGPGLSKPQKLEPQHEDVAMLLMHGGASVDPDVPAAALEKCMIGSLLGRKKELDAFVRQRYIYVSRVTGGATANALGQLCQAYVRERLQSALPTWNFAKKSIPGISQNAGRTNTSFDIIGESESGICCAIEVSFQVTTNSTIERKAGQAHSRQILLHQHGHKIAYVIDGAGNFQRKSAISTICAHSDCTVTFKDAELKSLVAYLRSLERCSELPGI